MRAFKKRSLFMAFFVVGSDSFEMQKAKKREKKRKAHMHVSECTHTKYASYSWLVWARSSDPHCGNHLLGVISERVRGSEKLAPLSSSGGKLGVQLGVLFLIVRRDVFNTVQQFLEFLTLLVFVVVAAAVHAVCRDSAGGGWGGCCEEEGGKLGIQLGVLFLIIRRGVFDTV
jgi:hypothetical protein